MRIALGVEILSLLLFVPTVMSIRKRGEPKWSLFSPELRGAFRRTGIFALFGGMLMGLFLGAVFQPAIEIQLPWAAVCFPLALGFVALAVAQRYRA